MGRLANEHNRTKVEFKEECQQRPSATKAKRKSLTKARAPTPLVSNFKKQNENEKVRKKNQGNRGENCLKNLESGTHQRSIKKEIKKIMLACAFRAIALSL